MTLNDISEIRVFVALAELAYLQHVSAAMSAVTKSIKRNKQCLHRPNPYRSKFTAASRGFPATARLSCLFWGGWELTI